MTHRIVVLALPGVITFELSGVLQLFADRSAMGVPEKRYELLLAGPQRGQMQTSDGLRLPIHHGLQTLTLADTVIIPGYVGAAAQAPSPAVLRALRAASSEGARMVSICVGAFALAHAGLLDGRRATTHWAASEELAAQFPAVQVAPDALYIDDGDLLTSAGLAAGLDLALHIVRTDHGSRIAAELARWNVIAPHRDGGQAQFITRPVALAPDEGLGRTRAWALERLNHPLTLADLAHHANCSERTLTRKFHSETGCSPKQWLIQIRLQHARELLESTNLAVEDIAKRTGFPTANALRTQFTALLHTTPGSYRRAFKNPDAPENREPTTPGSS